MRWEFDAERPIYVQLVSQLRTFILNGEYAPGSRLPSVRDLALETRVNPNTMQRALGELEAAGLIVTVRTSGKFVTQDAALIQRERGGLAEKLAEQYYEGMARIGFGRAEAEEMIHKDTEVK